MIFYFQIQWQPQCAGHQTWTWTTPVWPWHNCPSSWSQSPPLTSSSWHSLVRTCHMSHVTSWCCQCARSGHLTFPTLSWQRSSCHPCCAPVSGLTLLRTWTLQAATWQTCHPSWYWTVSRVSRVSIYQPRVWPGNSWYQCCRQWHVTGQHYHSWTCPLWTWPACPPPSSATPCPSSRVSSSTTANCHQSKWLQWSEQWPGPSVQKL